MLPSNFSYLVEQLNYYHQQHKSWSDHKKLQFLNQLEEEASLFFLEVEKKRDEAKKDSEEAKLFQEELHRIACFIDHLFQIFEFLDKNRKQEPFEKEKAKIIEHFLTLGSSRMKVWVDESGVKIFKPDAPSDPGKGKLEKSPEPSMQEMGILNRNQAGARATASYLISQELKLNFVPHTTVATYEGERGSLQEWVRGVSLIEKKIEKLFDASLYHLINVHTLPGLRKAIAREATGKGFWDPLSYGLILKPPLRYEKGNISVYKNGIPISDAKAQVFFMMRKIQLGEKKLSKMMSLDFSLPTLQKGLLDAQAFDFIIGQIDRYIGNILIKDQKVLVLIDHDYTFPTKFRTLDEATKKLLAIRSSLTELPPLLDRKTADHIMNFELERLYPEFLALGLTDEEIIACKSRLLLLKEHIHQLSREKKLIDIWTDETYRKLIIGRKNQEGLLIHNNYISKFLEEQRERRFILSLIEEKEKKWKASIASQRFSLT